jgi:putative transposase
VVAAGYPHHITQRGNYRQKIFSGDADHTRYLSILKDEAIRYHLIILAYCLMPNHLHVVAVPEREDSMWKVFKYAHMKYSQYYNRKMRTTGHLFQGRFFSSVMDERHTVACTRYVERNPVRAGITEKPTSWEWSSARVHCGINIHDVLGVNKLFDYIKYNQESWKDFVAIRDNPDEVKQIRENTIRGRPLGNDHFVQKLEKKLDRFLRLRPQGRPKKSK